MSYNLDVYTHVSTDVMREYFKNANIKEVRDYLMDSAFTTTSIQVSRDYRKMDHILLIATIYDCCSIEEIHGVGPDFIYMNLVFDSSDKKEECKKKLSSIFGIDIDFELEE